MIELTFAQKGNVLRQNTLEGGELHIISISMERKFVRLVVVARSLTEVSKERRLLNLLDLGHSLLLD